MAYYINFKEVGDTNVKIEHHESGDPKDYILGDTRAERFRQHLIRKGLVPRDEAEPERPAPLNTIEELYALCKDADPSLQVFKDKTAGDIYLGRENAELHKELFEDTALFELRFYDCEPEDQVIFFKYPYTEEKQFDCNINVRIFISNPNLYNTVIRELYEYEGPILAFTSWRPTGKDLLGSIDGYAQLARY